MLAVVVGGVEPAFSRSGIKSRSMGFALAGTDDGGGEGARSFGGGAAVGSEGCCVAGSRVSLGTGKRDCAAASFSSGIGVILFLPRTEYREFPRGRFAEPKTAIGML